MLEPLRGGKGVVYLLEASSFLLSILCFIFLIFSFFSFLLFLPSFLFILFFLFFFVLAFLFIFLKKLKDFNIRASQTVTRVTVGRDTNQPTNQPKFSSL